jgi:hypothetical protein
MSICDDLQIEWEDVREEVHYDLDDVEIICVLVVNVVD